MSVAHICHGQDGVGIGSEGCCSILGLEPGAGLTLLNCFFYGLVDAWAEDTSTSKQLCFSGSLVELVELL